LDVEEGLMQIQMIDVRRPRASVPEGRICDIGSYLS
jgi:hypothetical protein